MHAIRMLETNAAFVFSLVIAHKETISAHDETTTS